MWYYLQNHSDFFTKKELKLLHIAPEQCFHKKFKEQENLIYLTADLESPIADIHFDLHEIPLEENSFDELPGEVFIKGYIRSYANIIGSDVEELLNIYKESVELKRNEGNISHSTSFFGVQLFSENQLTAGK